MIRILAKTTVATSQNKIQEQKNMTLQDKWQRESQRLKTKLKNKKICG
jgi:hypothetical protein